MFLIFNSRKVSFTNQVVLSNQAGDSNEQPAGNLQSLTAGCDQNYILKKKNTLCKVAITSGRLHGCQSLYPLRSRSIEHI